MATFLVDYENTHQHGFAGLEKLSEDDFVVIFITQRMSAIPLNVTVSLTSCKARIVWKIHDQSSKPVSNYLDMQLATYLGSLVGASKAVDIAIISKDRDYLAVSDFWKQNRPSITVVSAATITEGRKLFLSKTETQVTIKSPSKAPAPSKIKPAIKKKVGEVLKSFNLAGGNYAVVYTVFRQSQNSEQFNGGITKTFSQTLAKGKATDLAAKLLPIYTDYRSG